MALNYIGCKNEHGFTVRLYKKNNPVKTIYIKGYNTSEHYQTLTFGLQSERGLGITEVDESVAALFSEQYKEWPPLKNGIVFVAQNKSELTGKTNELINLKSAFDRPDADKIDEEAQKASDLAEERERANKVATRAINTPLKADDPKEPIVDDKASDKSESKK